MEHFWVSALVIFVWFVALFVVGQVKHNNSIVDFGWGLGFVLVAVANIALNASITTTQLLVCLAVFAWGIRLAYHIAKRNFGKPEDYRYVEMRNKWKKHPVLQAFFKVYMLQAVFMFVVALPIMIVFYGNAPKVTPFAVLGLIVWCVGYFFEVVGDKQLKNFVSKPENKGKIMQSGLWKFTRHPNYFGESVMWWGLATTTLFGELFYLAFVSPLVITWLLLFVSGVPLLEKKYANNAEFLQYAKRTSKFFPLPPKKNKE